MDSDPFEHQGDQLAERLRQEQRDAAPHRWECSAALRCELVAYAEACRATGESHLRVAGRLGLVQSTLSRWVRKARSAPPSVRQLAIVPSARRREPAPRPALRLISPHGFVVEGLDLQHLAHLLRVLG